MPGRTHRRRPAVMAGGLAFLLTAVACTGPGMGARQSTGPQTTSGATEAVAVASATPMPPAGFQVGTVRVGPITESVTLTGRVADRSEAPVGLPVSVRIASMLVEPGHQVSEGQPLAEVDTSGLEREIHDLRARRDAADTRLERTRSVLQARRQRAEEDLARLTAPPSESEQLQAAGAVATAREQLRRAEADVAALNAPSAVADARAAEQAVLSAQAAVRKAEADLARVRRGADPSELRKAQNDLASAESAYAKAVEAHRVLTAGPEPFALRAAERAVLDAQQQILTLQRTQPLPPVYQRTNDDRADREARRRAEREAENARVARQAEMQKAELGLKSAVDQLNKVRQPPPDAEVLSAVRAVESAERSLIDARERLALLQAGPKPEDVEAAELAVASAQAGLDRAIASLEAARAGPSESAVAAARASLVSARSSVEVAQARQRELLANKDAGAPDVRAAQERIALLQKLSGAQIEELDDLSASIDPKDREMLDAVSLYREAVRATGEEQARLQQSEQQLESLRLVAPFSGVVTAMLVAAGEMTQPGKPVLLLARPSAPVIRTEIAQREGSRLAAGQRGRVELTDQGGATFDAMLTDVDDGEGERRLTLDVVWGSTPPTYGQQVQTTILVQEKTSALLVPRRAVTNVGSRRYVDVFDRTPPRRVPVELGLTNQNDVEVLGDLREGQPVLLAP
jgi:multidrug efflux pump subunit AcrA (membrane-fusion protein)